MLQKWISDTSLDFLNMDISTKDLNDAGKVHRSCDWTTILEWGVFEVSTTILLVGIFFWLMVGDGVSHCRSFLKNRGTKSQRLQKELERVTKEQQKLALKVGTAGFCLDSSSAHASNAAPPAADSMKPGTFSTV